MSLKIRIISEEPGEPMTDEGQRGVNSVMAVPKREDISGYSCRIIRFEPGGATTFHEHDREHVIFVLSGKIRVETSSEMKEVKPGMIVQIPTRLNHRFVNSNNKRAALMVQNIFV
jgi:quercetin dioxygenase-like cupin family protein